MKKPLIFVSILFFFFSLTSCAKINAAVETQEYSSTPFSEQPVSTTSPEPGEVLSLGYYNGSQESYDSVIAFAPWLDIVSVDVFGLQSDITVVGIDDFNIAAQSGLEGIDFYACISNWNSDPAVDDFDSELARAAILTYREELIPQLVALAQTEGYAGINIDFENLAYSDDLSESRTAFTDFIHELAARLHENDRKLIISVAAKESDDPNNEWSYPYDLASLGEDADYLQLMTYDQHGSWGGPGSVSGADWVEECVKYTSSIVEPSKLLIGLPDYGYDWDLSEPGVEDGTFLTTDFNWTDVPGLLAKPGAEVIWDEASQTPSVAYTDNGHSHVAWFENTESIQAKVKLIPQYNLAGLSVWALGKEDLGFWQAATQLDPQ
jgi:spore germination protein